MIASVSVPEVLYVVAICFLVFTPPVVTLLKGHVALFAAGFLTVGLVWVIAEFRLARPNSPWAQRFYDAEEQRRSQERYPNVSPPEPNSSITVLAVVFGVFAVLFLGGFASVVFS